MICELLFPSSILAVKLNRKTLVIVLEVEIYIYDISNMRLLHIIETTPNPEGKRTNYQLHEKSRVELRQQRAPSHHPLTTLTLHIRPLSLLLLLNRLVRPQRHRHHLLVTNLATYSCFLHVP
jgi:hypothetical protein